MKKINDFLTEKKNEGNKLQKEVIEILESELINYSLELDKIKCINQILKEGCITGIVGNMITWYDTINFYDTNYKELTVWLFDTMFLNGYNDILKLIPGLDNSESLNSDNNKNYITWFVFEGITFDLFNEYENQE